MITPLRQQMQQDLQLAGLSERTQEAYLRAVRQLADHFHTQQAEKKLNEAASEGVIMRLR